MPPKRFGRGRRYGRGVNRRGTKYGFLKTKTFKRTRTGRGRYGKRRRTVRRRVRRRTNRTRGRRPKITYKQVADALETEKAIIATYGQGHVCQGYSIPGHGCLYLTTEKYTAVNSARTAVKTVLLGNTDHLLKIADKIWPTSAIVTNQLERPQYNQDYLGKFMLKGSLVYTLRNQSNEHENVTAYYCKVRQNRNFYNTGTINNVYDVLGMGFGMKGLNILNPTATSTAVTEGVWTPYDSPLFLNMFKIEKAKRFRIPTGGEKKFAIKLKRRTVQPSMLTNLLNDTEIEKWSDKNIQNNYAGGARFILFKVDARIAGYTGQSAVPAAITYTTPSIIMESAFKYKAKMVTTASHSHVWLEGLGYGLNTSNIMVQSDWVAGEEKDAAL